MRVKPSAGIAKEMDGLGGATATIAGCAGKFSGVGAGAGGSAEEGEACGVGGGGSDSGGGTGCGVNWAVTICVGGSFSALSGICGPGYRRPKPRRPTETHTSHATSVPMGHSGEFVPNCLVSEFIRNPGEEAKAFTVLGRGHADARAIPELVLLIKDVDDIDPPAKVLFS